MNSLKIYTSIIKTVHYEDYESCHNSLFKLSKKTYDFLENFVQNLGSDHRWIIYDIQQNLISIMNKLRTYRLKAISLSMFIACQESLLYEVQQIEEISTRYLAFGNWVRENKNHLLG